MVKPAYMFFAFLTLLIFLAILVAFVVLPGNDTEGKGPFDRGDTPSQVETGKKATGAPNE